MRIICRLLVLLSLAVNYPSSGEMRLGKTVLGKHSGCRRTQMALSELAFRLLVDLFNFVLSNLLCKYVRLQTQ